MSQAEVRNLGQFKKRFLKLSLTLLVL